MTPKQRFIRWYIQDIHRGNALLAFLILALGIAFSLYQVERRSNESSRAIVVSSKSLTIFGCNRDFRTILILRDILAEEGKRLILPDCRKSLGVLTDDPNKISTFPPALSPNEK